VILVEDNPALAKAYAIALEHDGHTVAIAADEPGLRSLLAGELPELLLLDVGLPGVDGVEILRELRLDPRTAELRVAVVSNYSDRDLIHRSLKLDALEYVEKAATSPSLLAKQVRRWLER
jgi:two-component system KDP operon response regulator KdpE